jgi:hypothetical protein
MPVCVQLSPLLPRYVPGHDHGTGIFLDQANGRTMLQVLEGLTVPAGKFPNITIVVDSCPENPKSVVAGPEWITLTKAIEDGEPAMQLT